MSDESGDLADSLGAPSDQENNDAGESTDNDNTYPSTSASSSDDASATDASEFEDETDSDDDFFDFSLEERRDLSINVSKLTGENLDIALGIIQYRELYLRFTEDDELEVDFLELRTSTLRELDAFVCCVARLERQPKPKPFNEYEVCPECEYVRKRRCILVREMKNVARVLRAMLRTTNRALYVIKGKRDTLSPSTSSSSSSCSSGSSDEMNDA